MSDPLDPPHAPPGSGRSTPNSGKKGPGEPKKSSPGIERRRRRRSQSSGGGRPSMNSGGGASSPSMNSGQREQGQGQRQPSGSRPEIPGRPRRPEGQQGGGPSRRSGRGPRRDRPEGEGRGPRQQAEGAEPGRERPEGDGRPRRDRDRPEGEGRQRDGRPRRDRPEGEGRPPRQRAEGEGRPRRDRPESQPRQRSIPGALTPAGLPVGMPGMPAMEDRPRRPFPEERERRAADPFAPSVPMSPPMARSAESPAADSRLPWLIEDDEVPPEQRMVRVRPSEPIPPEVPVRFYELCGVRTRPTGPAREYDCRNERYAVGDWVLVESERTQRLGQVVVATRRRHSLSTPRRVIRRARPDEVAERTRATTAETEAHRFCKERLRERKLSMKLVQTEVVPGQKATFYFASEDRVDFRELVRDLAQQLHTRIEMRQIGARDGAKAVGGIGSCGRELCCTTFLPAFQPISIRMAKDQGMVLNPSKLAGQCGRLKCCLVYEHHTYKEMGKGLPKVGKRIQTPAGIGRVLDLDILRQRVRVLLEEGGAQTFEAAELRPMTPPGGGGGGQAQEPLEAADSGDGVDAKEVAGLSDDA